MTAATWLHAAAAASGNAANWIVAWVAIATAACTALAFLGRRMWHLRQRWLHMLAQARLVLAAYLGTEGQPGVPARPGVMEQLAALTAGVARLNAEVIPNGGSSLRDAVDRVASDLREHREVTSPAIRGLAADMAGVKDDVARMAGRMDGYENERAARDLTRWPGNPPAKDGPA